VAARRKRRDDLVTTRGDEDAPDPVEAADVDVVDDDELEEAGLSELDEDADDAFDDEDEDDDDEVAGAAGEEELEVPLEEGLDPDETDEAVVPAVPAEAAFDDEEEARVVAAVVSEDEDEAGIDGLRDEEFVCRSCYMAKRDSQLADPERMLCRDCA
jgi:hypothetical protein